MTTQKATRNLIINADDFGESVEINEGILQTHRDGIVTSASLLTNMAGFEHAISALKSTPTLDIGIHLNMHRGIPLTQCPYLTREGKFLRNIVRFTIRSYVQKKRARAEVFQEFDAQIQKAIAAGIRISHLDTEKHLHTLPFVFQIVLELAQKYNISTVRLPYERVSFRALLNPAQFYKTAVMVFFAPHNRQLLKKSTCKSTRDFYGVSLSRRFNLENLKNVCDQLRPGFTEISCHPGLTPHKSGGYIDTYRDAERITLTDSTLKAHIQNSGIVLSTFFDIR